MRFASIAAAALAFLPAALATITINQPSSSEYWVQNTSNIIAWSFDNGDTNPISIIITNTNDTKLNGNFSIAEFVDLSNGTFTVTNVTLVVADEYSVSFVNPTNHSIVLATSQPFSVRAPGTAPASSSGSPTSASGSGSASSSASSTSSGSPSSSANPNGNANNNAAISTFSAQGIIGLIAACGVASLSAVLL